MLFDSELWGPIERGEVTLAFRRWKRATVKAGGTLQSPSGLLAIDEVTVVDEGDVTEADAVAAGAGSVAEVLAALPRSPDRTLYRIRFHRQGDDPRVALRQDDDLGDVARADIDAQLDRWDRASNDGPWTRRLLDAVASGEGRRSVDLAADLGMDQPKLKRRVRQLKSLGLTESLEVGYRLSPRGAVYRG